MGVYQKLADDIREVDVIIAGGGTAGCVVAGRLAEADPSLSILVIETGADNYNVPSVVNPALFLEHLAPSSKTALFYKSNKSEHLAGRECIVPAGGTLGGGSSINFMMYTRAQKSDFDSWKTPGWSADELVPFLKKFETYHSKGDPKYHGHDGPVHISDGGYRALKSENDFIEAAGKVGYEEASDLNDLHANNAVGRWSRYVSPDGKRQDAAHTFLHPKLRDGKHPNLHVLVESQVVRVLFDNNKRACGVEFMPNPEFQSEIGLTKHPKQTVRARKLVVVSCGACGSPSVLERSGVGSASVLQRAGVPLVADVPGIGHDYQDHHLVLLPYKTALAPHETNDALASGRLPRDEALAQGGKVLGWNAVDVAGKLRPTEAEAAALGPEFAAAWARDFRHQPDRPLMLMAMVNMYLGDHSAVEPGQYVTVGTYTAYPYSRGRVHITGPEPADPLDFDVGFFSDAHDIDLKKQVWAYKKQREMMRRTAMFRGEVAAGHPRFPAGSAAACVDGPVPGGEVRDIAYSAEDDRAIERFLRESVNTTWHSLGTAKMAPRDQMGAVDGSLSVYGVGRLKVVDLSIAPGNVGANTNNTAFLVGEKGADIIIKELGLAGGKEELGRGSSEAETSVSRRGPERGCFAPLMALFACNKSARPGPMSSISVYNEKM